jgi:hypothetical protein
MAKSTGQVQFSFFAIDTNKLLISSFVGAGMRIPRQRERNGSIIFEGELQSNIIRHWEEYLQKMFKIIFIKIEK